MKLTDKNIEKIIEDEIYNVVDGEELYYSFETYDTSQVTDMSFLFYKYPYEYLDVSSFDTSKVKDMSGMFQKAEDLTTLNIRSFNFNKVENFNGIFHMCYSLDTIYGIENLLKSKKYQSLSEKEQYELFEDTKIDLKKELKKLNNKKEKER